MHWKAFVVVSTVSALLKIVCLMRKHYVPFGNSLNSTSAATPPPPTHTHTHTSRSIQGLVIIWWCVWAILLPEKQWNTNMLYFSSSYSEYLSCLPPPGDILSSQCRVSGISLILSFRNCHGQVCLYVLVNANIRAKEVNVKDTNQQLGIMNNLYYR